VCVTREQLSLVTFAGAALELGWEALLAIVAGLVALVFVAALIVVRERQSRRFRVGFFVERDVDPDDWEDP
jgi:hypothetical protein